jgi:hypothetical protein
MCKRMSLGYVGSGGRGLAYCTAHCTCTVWADGFEQNCDCECGTSSLMCHVRASSGLHPGTHARTARSKSREWHDKDSSRQESAARGAHVSGRTPHPPITQTQSGTAHEAQCLESRVPSSRSVAFALQIYSSIPPAQGTHQRRRAQALLRPLFLLAREARRSAARAEQEGRT